MNRVLLILIFLCIQPKAFSQKSKSDSLYILLSKEHIDSNRVNLMWKIAEVVSIYDPEKSLKIGRDALYLAKKIEYAEGQSRSLGILANIFIKLGNYPRALEFNIQKLQLEENKKNPKNMASVLMNIGVVYVFQEEYRKALPYYYQSDSLIEKYNIQEFKYNIALNLGDLYDRLGITDTAYSFYKKSLDIAFNLNNDYLIGVSMTGLGHIYRKQHKFQLSQNSYQKAIVNLQEAHDDDLLCEASLGLATLYQEMNENDSAAYYAKMARFIAEKDGFLPRHLDAANFLTDHYKKLKNTDSAFYYLNYVQNLNATINSKTRIRESQILSSNEQLRQIEIEENKRIAKLERHQQLQWLFIGIFIPGFFLLTLLMSKIRIHPRLIKILGVLSLLILFEYLLLLLHPYVTKLTNHTPVYEMLIFVSMAAILIPGHHRIEHWLIQRLTNNRPFNSGIRIKRKTMKLKKQD